MNTHIFLFTLGPVQSFIAQSRKLKDLFAGSYMLSSLTKVAIDEAIENGMEMKFPFYQENSNSIPNRFVATILGKNKEELANIGKLIEAKVVEKLKDFAKESLKKEKTTSPPTGFWEQIDQHLDIQWAFYPIENDYIAAFKRIEHLVGAMKNTRVFEQFQFQTEEGLQYGEAGRKCNLSGERNALFLGKGSNKNNLLGTEGAIILDNTDEVYLRPNEGLSAISFVKRFLPLEKLDEKRKFESIAEISLMHIIKSDVDAVKTALKDYRKAFYTNDLIRDVLEKCELRKIKYDKEVFKEGFDEQFLYDENLIKKSFPCGFQLEEIQERYKNFKQVLKKNSAKLTKYYAVITFDGDEMGKWLSGAKVRTNEKFHKDISTKLNEFASIAENILKTPKGATVYAGGDDFLGLVNLYHLFEVVRDLRVAFEKEVNIPLKEEYKYDTDFTFSAGIAIAHYKTPLSIVLESARQMMEVAKEERDRNAFGLAVMKHSGETEKIAYKWGDIDIENKTVSNWDAIKTIVEQLLENPVNKKPNFSNTFIQNSNRLYGEILALDATLNKSDDNTLFDNMFQTDLVRLVNRSCQVKQKEEKSQAIQELGNALSLLSHTEVRDSYSNFLETLYVCQFLTRQL